MAVTLNPKCFAATHQGRKRAHNEDSYLADAELGVFAVADGMGGHQAGEVASALAVRTVHEVLQQNRALLEPAEVAGPRSEVSRRDVLGLLEWAVQEASRRIHAQAQRDEAKRGMGTTLSVVVLLDAHAYVAHVGDSRVYLLRGDRVEQITDDHTIGNELVRLGVVARDQLHAVPRRNAITRAVGIYEHVEVDTLTLEVLPHDQFVLASDGLTGYLDATQENLAAWAKPGDGQQVVHQLVGFANDCGGKDNITAVLVRLGRGGLRDSARAKQLELKREMLQAMPLFSRLAERELRRVMHVAEVVAFAPGEVVMRQGEAGDRMFVCLDGRLQVFSHQTAVGELQRGEHFGEMSLVRNLPRSATVKATVPSQLIAIARDDFFELIREEPRVAVKLLWQFLGVLAHRLDRTSQDLSLAREAGLGTRQQWIDDEPSLDPFATPPSSSYLPPSIAGPSLAEKGRSAAPSDDDAAVTPRRAGSSETAAVGPVDAGMTAPPAPPPGRASEPEPNVARGDDAFDARRTMPSIPSTRRVRARTLKSAEPRREDDRKGKTTLPDGLRRVADEAFRPSHETLPLEQPEGLEEELADLRREFKERLAQARRDRKKRDD
ncbi:MAG: cyclic nucleotide-binding domain-containing protein [Myxococcota bacterium]